MSPRDHYDVVVVGGGIHGAALTWELSRRGATVAMLEQDDFGSGASANSLKIIHGGLRYLQNFDWIRSRRSAREQAFLKTLAPHLIRDLPCVMPTYREFKKSRIAVLCGLFLYDRFIKPSHRNTAGTRSALLSLENLQSLAPVNITTAMTGGAIWQDAQVYNTERFTLSYVLTAAEQGADVFNYVRAESLEIIDERVCSVGVRNRLTGERHRLGCSVAVNATGSDIFDAPFRFTRIDQRRPVFLRAVNLILPHRLGDYAVGISVPEAGRNGNARTRLLFFTPCGDASIVGTWYFPDRRDLGQAITREELRACLRDINGRIRNLSADEADVRHVHVGRLPAVDSKQRGQLELMDRSAIIDSRLEQGFDGLLSILSIKYTTARLVAERAVNTIADKLGMPAISEPVPPRLTGGDIDDFDAFTEQLQHRYHDRFSAAILDRMARYYGSYAEDVIGLADETPALAEIIPGSAVIAAELQYAMEQERAYTLADAVLRRTGLGHLGRPPQSTIDYCAERMSGYYQWDQEQLRHERERLDAAYQRLVDD